MYSKIPEQCKQCANSRFFNHEYRCARYHDAVCSRMYDFCSGSLFLNKGDNMSLYAAKSWLECLSSNELQLPLVFDVRNQTFIPLMVVKTYNSLYGDHWRFYIKKGDRHE